ncbi:imidazoleglycerol-phosphate dehydratase HisB [Rubinisphaera sp.]|uniref:imidazoleglycerol-phosphate dehydratase HisB n=1 Tax=Rubinisphaera sp. TaxID=2024857 RepID=UPI000C0D17C0|nr:imidazoleglycerol-phosphate dehydratase HisB [Rubinisphaera sp.]MBV11636.1 imidazoleglycerol-phosphate dehydratase [Rubinisphaera sp.]HCS51383.1 imidazoleglycerol-phosphate dehydratase HisB [Planctomycetaceae bacterium]|tara:strand:- start:24223 stop:24816 length:594 start_codon:yes stop_codon:yes gene_type:complete
MARKATIKRKTGETEIELAFEIDGSGNVEIETGVGFLDHMLTLFAKHGLFDFSVKAVGDLHVDHHHTVEDIGICLGKAIHQAIGDKQGITRYGSMTLPMDETLVTVALDLSGRVWFENRFAFPTEKIGEFDTQLVAEFFQAFAANSLMNLHVVLHHGANSHHISEAIFKATARALRIATTVDPRQSGVPSSKGTLTE